MKSLTSKRYKHESAFTLVELLIVIVVIGILAAITVVAYNNMQRRAINTQTSTNVSTYERAIYAYRAENGTYPSFSVGNGGACLGQNYSDHVGSDGVGDCGESAYPVNVDATFNADLTKIISSLPIVNDRSIAMPYQSSTWVGAAMHYYPPDPSRTNAQEQDGFTVNGIYNPYYLMYVLDGGNEDCKNSNLVIPDESAGGWPKMTTTMPSSQKWSWSDNKTTACVVRLQNP